MKLKCQIELTEENGYFTAPPIIFFLEKNTARKCGYDVIVDRTTCWNEGARLCFKTEIEDNLRPGTEYRRFIDREWERMVRSAQESHEHWDAASRVDMVGMVRTVCGIGRRAEHKF
jgi:hypothetical protein